MRDLLEMEWRDALFAHWRADPQAVEARLPAGLSVATRDGDAWLGVVAFEMADLRPRGAPVGRRFGEVNLRTYVEAPDGGRGVYFFSLDADDRLGVTAARLGYDLPYYAAQIDLRRAAAGADGGASERGRLRVTSRRVHGGAPTATLDATYRPTGEAYEADPGSLDAFHAENYAYYLGEPVRRGEIAHPPWTLRPAEMTLHRTSLFAAAGLDRPPGEPVVRYSPGSTVTAGLPSRTQ